MARVPKEALGSFKGEMNERFPRLYDTDTKFWFCQCLGTLVLLKERMGKREWNSIHGQKIDEYEQNFRL